jgi:hypothetical protein
MIGLPFSGRNDVRVLKAVVVSSLFVTAMPALAEDKAALDRNDPNAVRCKRIAVTGSLVRKERTCRTNAEWKKISEQQNRDADDLITRSRSGMNPSG